MSVNHRDREVPLPEAASAQPEALSPTLCARVYAVRRCSKTLNLYVDPIEAAFGTTNVNSDIVITTPGSQG